MSDEDIGVAVFLIMNAVVLTALWIAVRKK
jgi:hypothetical protein